MKWGKLQISEEFIFCVFIASIFFIILHFTLAEEKLKEETKQLELKKEIILLEKENNYERSNNN